mmetsp:Transcript_43405/g.102134  ORF Transcript_43405/g.102134 Transcript_43405/m.102134 type:complete len:275 (+) Transcript_43405:52-876(+)
MAVLSMGLTPEETDDLGPSTLSSVVRPGMVPVAAERRKRVASGLNSGVSMKSRKRLSSRRRSPSNDLSERPRLRRSASRSMSSSISRVRGDSNSLTVHLTCSRTSSRSSTLSLGSLSPLYRSISSLARVVKGVCTDATVPSPSSHSLGAAISSSCFETMRSLFSLAATALSRSMVCTSLISLSTTPKCAARRSSSGTGWWLMFSTSLYRHASSSSYSTSKSSTVRGCMRRSTSRCRRCSSSSARCLSSASLATRDACNSFHSRRARVRANIPRA